MMMMMMTCRLSSDVWYCDSLITLQVTLCNHDVRVNVLNSVKINQLTMKLFRIIYEIFLN